MSKRHERLPLCGAKTRSGKPCKNPAGLRTQHPGTGKCYKHGGNSVIKHGRYSKVRGEFAKKMLRHAEDKNPADLVPELTILRTLLEGWIDKNTDNIDVAIPGIIALADNIRKIVDTINKIQTREALTANESLYLLATLADVLQTEIKHIRREEISDEEAIRHILGKLRTRVELPGQARGQALLVE